MSCNNSKTCKTGKHIGGNAYICDHNNLKVNYPELIEEWNSKNGLMENYPFSSHKRVLWNCKNDPCGCHEWETKVKDRTGKNSGCPYCCNRKICEHSSLLASHPLLCEEWDYEKNDVSPSEIAPGSDKKVWWRCRKDTCACHTWQAQVFSRTRSIQSGCPYCCNNKTCIHSSLLAFHSQLCKEWDYEKNDISPSKISPGSTKLAWWICSKNPCGCHKWRSRVADRTKATNPRGCPFCAHKKVCDHTSLLFSNPELCKEWDYEKNGISPNEIMRRSNKNFWWKCEKNQHGWRATVNNRTRVTSSECPKCRLCPSCMLWITNGKLCEYCKPRSENKLYQKTKEMTVVKFLKDNLPDEEFIHNRSVGKDCTDGHLFPDIRFECFYYGDNVLNYNLIVEVDEFQHRGASYECDKQRMYDIVAKISAPCIFIRYNPDGKESDIKVLLKYVKKCLKSPISKTGNFVWNKFGLKCIYLYYKS